MINSELILNWILAAVFSLIASSAFAVIFHAPKKEIIPAGICGSVGWIVYVIFIHFNISTVWSSFFAAIVLAWISRIFSYLRKNPVTIYLITGIFPLVPGLGIYRTGYSLFMNENRAVTLNLGLETIEIAIAISLGLGLVLSLPAVLFFGKRHWKAGGRK